MSGAVAVGMVGTDGPPMPPAVRYHRGTVSRVPLRSRDTDRRGYFFSPVAAIAALAARI